MVYIGAIFIIYSFFGWLMESLLFTMRKGKFVNRGFLKGPYTPIYGVGMIIILKLLSPFHSNIFLLFISSGIICSVLEYITGFVLEKTFKTRWWDYSKKPFNLQGYVCLENSIDWCILGCVMIRIVQPEVNKLINVFTYSTLSIIVYVILAIMILDLITTARQLFKVKEITKYIEELHSKVLLEVKDGQKAIYNKLIDDVLVERISFDDFIKAVEKLNISSGLKKLSAKIESIYTSDKPLFKRWKENYDGFGIVNSKRLQKIKQRIEKIKNKI
ncbi:putative ABC transporter permease [Mycoplasma sp. P36-A1]|uniref:putative ABC transporter permease n=1 Tax=Mycoplasma sp. P36-A1 TaxID=3252900 RepID=UPI003C30B7BB